MIVVTVVTVVTLVTVVTIVAVVTVCDSSATKLVSTKTVVFFSTKNSLNQKKNFFFLLSNCEKIKKNKVVTKLKLGQY